MKRIAVVLVAACSQKVYSPPSQAFSVTPIAALPDRRQAVDVELARHHEIFDPAVDSGAARLRTGLGDHTEASVEGTALVVRDHGPSHADRNIYMGRAGLRTNPGASNVTYFAGAGGGYSGAAGDFIALDAGVAVGYQNCVLVPSFQASGFVSQPIDARAVDVSDDPKHAPEFDTPTRTVGYTLRAGLRLSLAPSACRRGEPVPWLYTGVGGTKLYDADSDALYGGFGFGLEIPL